MVAEKKGELDRAEQLYRESLDMSVNLCGEEGHLDVTRTTRRLASVILKRGNVEEGVKMYRDSFEMERQLDGNFDRSSALCMLGNDLLEVWALEEAEGVERKCFDAAMSLRGESGD